MNNSTITVNFFESTHVTHHALEGAIWSTIHAGRMGRNSVSLFFKTVEDQKKFWQKAVPA